VTSVEAEGWYQDPFGLHEARWFSVGTPTSLVRDGEVESQDEPPAAEYAGVPEELRVSEAHDGEDLRRADDQEEPFSDRKAVDAAFDDASGLGNLVYHRSDRDG
jgi:hypothetical protein